MKREITKYCRSGNLRVFNFLRIPDLGIFTKFGIREFLFFFGSIIMTILNLQICPPREIRENLNLANTTRSRVYSKLRKVEVYI